MGRGDVPMSDKVISSGPIRLSKRWLLYQVLGGRRQEIFPDFEGTDEELMDLIRKDSRDSFVEGDVIGENDESS